MPSSIAQYLAKMAREAPCAAQDGPGTGQEGPGQCQDGPQGTKYCPHKNPTGPPRRPQMPRWGPEEAEPYNYPMTYPTHPKQLPRSMSTFQTDDDLARNAILVKVTRGVCALHAPQDWFEAAPMDMTWRGEGRNDDDDQEKEVAWLATTKEGEAPCGSNCFPRARE